MDKSNPPRSFGVFKPAGHTVIAFSNAADLEAAADALLEQGFTTQDMVRYTPAEMKAQVDADLKNASPLASVGQELNLVKAHYGLAQEGCSFLVVHAPEPARAQRVEAVLHRTHARAAQRYGSFMIEELVDSIEGKTQVFESPAGHP
jgi:hypothetical protein